MDYLNRLNDKQLEAVTHMDGPCLVLAGAGSGKTRVLTTRIAHLIDSGVPDYNILAITFTNKAAKEMRERLDILIPGNAAFVGTFHSLGLRIIRENYALFNLTSTFTILDSDDVLSVIKKILKDKNYDPKVYAPTYIRNRISFIKNENLNDAEINKFFNTPPEKVALDVYYSYKDKLVQNNSVDFDDLLLLPVKLFRENKMILEKYQNRFKYILIDEYQDTNEVQYKMTKLLAKVHKNIFCVGDPDQCLTKDTLIETVNGIKKIAEIKTNDLVKSGIGYNKTDFKLVEKVIKKPYRGLVYEIITSSGKKLQATGNHIVFSNVVLYSGKYYVYLMYRSDKGFRIGQSSSNRVINGKTVNGIYARLNGEKGDKIWIIKVCANKQEANFYEDYYAFNYGIPKTVFHEKGRHITMSQESLNQLFASINTYDRATELMKDEGLYYEYPHHVGHALNNHNSKERKNLILTFLGGKSNKANTDYHSHRISLNTCNEKDINTLKNNGFGIRIGKNEINWRIETERKKYDDLENFAESICKVTSSYDIYRKMRLTDYSYNFMPVSSLKTGMTLVTIDNGKLIEETINEINQVEYNDYVYDINIADTRNYFANNICVHNSIYSFRGANFQNIMNFEKDYQNSRIIPLEENYRSTKIILDTANSVIKNNKMRKDKVLWSTNEDGIKPKYLRSYDEKHEITQIIGEIKKLIDQGFNPGKIGILYRTNAQSRIVEEQLIKVNMPYKVVGSYYFYNRKEIKDLLSYLRLILNNYDEISLRRVINVPKRGIGNVTIEAIEKKGLAERITMFDAIDKGKELEFKNIILELSKMAENSSLTELIDLVLEKSGIKFELEKEKTIEAEVRLENLMEFKSITTSFEERTGSINLSDFLEEVSLIADISEHRETEDVVTLMTIHSAKGLEFDAVFLIGMEEGIFPHSNSFLEEGGLEEERRLCYVGITRARKRLFLSNAKRRLLYGRETINPPSRFINEIDPNLIDVENPMLEDKPKINKDNFYSDEEVDYSAGDVVTHTIYGRGVVIETSGDLITIAFAKNFGIKKLLKNYKGLHKN